MSARSAARRSRLGRRLRRLRDVRFGGTPAEWADQGGHVVLAHFLRRSRRAGK